MAELFSMDFDLNLGDYRGDNYDNFYINKNYEDKNFKLVTFTQPIPTVKLVWDSSKKEYKKARGRGRPLESQENKNQAENEEDRNGTHLQIILQDRKDREQVHSRKRKHSAAQYEEDHQDCKEN